MEQTHTKEYALLLLARTPLTYNQISELTGFSLSQINAWAQDARPKEMRDANVLRGVTPDVQEELQKLKQVMLEEIKSAKDVVRPPIIRNVTFKYSSVNREPSIQKSYVLDELERIISEIQSLNSGSIKLHLMIEGV